MGRRRYGRNDLEVFRIEDVTWDERYRVCFLRRSEEFMPEVREFCKKFCFYSFLILTLPNNLQVQK